MDNQNYEKIGNTIRDARIEKGLTQEQLSEQIGIPQCKLSNLEHAKKGSGIDNIDKLVAVGKALEIPMKLEIDGKVVQLNKTKKDFCLTEEEKQYYELSEECFNHIYANIEWLRYYFAKQKIDASNFILENPETLSTFNFLEDKYEAVFENFGDETIYKIWLSSYFGTIDTEIPKEEAYDIDDEDFPEDYGKWIYPSKILINTVTLHGHLYTHISFTNTKPELRKYGLNKIFSICERLSDIIYDEAEKLPEVCSKLPATPEHPAKNPYEISPIAVTIKDNGNFSYSKIQIKRVCELA